MTPFSWPAPPRLTQLRLRVRSLETMTRFYGDVLGLERLPAGEGADPVAVFGPSTDKPLVHLTQATGAPARPEHAVGLHHFALNYGDRHHLAHAVRRLVEHRWPLQGATDHGIAESIYLADPEGNGIELYLEFFEHGPGPRPRAGRRPLDLTALLELAAAAPFAERAPSSLEIGHIHLQVAALEAAERFYHECLGFAVRGRVPGAIFFTASHEHHQLAANAWSGYAPAPRGSLGLAAWRLHVRDVTVLDAIRQRAAALGYEILLASSAGSPHVLCLADPRGPIVEIEAMP